MSMKSVLIRNISLMVVFGAIGLTTFTENVRTVQIVGLFATGMIFSASLSAILAGLIKSKQSKE